MAGPEATARTDTPSLIISDSAPLNARSCLDQSCEDGRCQNPKARIWHCVDCDSNYCEECWSFQGPHRAGKLGRDGVPHEQTDISIVSRLQQILQPPTEPDAIKHAHEEDQSTKWFGVTRDMAGTSHLEDYGRYATLIGSLQPLESTKDRYPQLVSFIGVTNAGKSTIIKMLVNHGPAGKMSLDEFPSPVAGSIANDKVPTSGDVHLYADRSTHAGRLPILYADCEGFEGGEKMPLGARVKQRPCSEPGTHQFERSQSRSLPIQWANSEHARQREFAVKELYPRLLYTFSDVVVFVLRNPKTFQSAVLGKLLDWGAAAFEKSLNQPSLPHAIVLLNDTEAGIDEREWNTDNATESLLSCVAGALDYVEGVPRFRELAQHWRNLGRQVNNVRDLIHLYYSSFKVVRIPRKPRYTLMDRQVGRLHTEIRADCEASFKAKRQARMLTNADELNMYLRCAFEHFTNTLDSPFNFVEVSLMNYPISYDFGGHMLQLVNTVSARQPTIRRGAELSRWIFERLCLMVASCIMLDCARFRKGRVDDLFDSYKKFLHAMLHEYCEMWLPCAYTNAQGRCCLLVKARHNTKGHQDGHGIISDGAYEASFLADDYALVWEQQVKSAVSAVQSEFQRDLDQAAQFSKAESDEKIALRLHRQGMHDFYISIGGPDEVISHASCFCCLMEVPEHPLPCGHVLCSACIKAYGKRIGKSVVELRYCPLHMDTTRWLVSHQVRFKHEAAGTRILCLDGGGIRGIAELEVLRAIEQALGGEIPIQAFFDLIVGTSTGGIIALALGVQQWPVDRCISMFTSLCNHAYTPRMKGVPILDLAAAISHGSKYKTKVFHEALKDAFGEQDYLFGGRTRSTHSTQTKVAVTSTTSTGSKAVVLANYRRKEDRTPEYDFERPHDPELEMQVWEAAAATSSAPTYFKPFVKSLTRRTYLDGALHYNNPARVANRERKLIWPESAEADPDIFLSLGTGQNRISILPKLSARTTDWKTLRSSLQASSAEDLAGVRRYFRSWTLLYNRMDDILNAEVAWATFRNDVVSREEPRRNTRRYIRFNPDLNKSAPSIDAKDELSSLQWTVKKRLSIPHCVTAVHHVAHRLVASSFFVEVQKQQSLENGSQSFECSVLCKFDDGTHHLRALGRYLRNLACGQFRPHIVVKMVSESDRGCTINDISAAIMERMVEHAEFKMPSIRIVVEDGTKASNVLLTLCPHDGLEPEGFSLSGFPKVLASECVTNVAAHPKLRIARQEVTKSSSPKGSNRSLKLIAESVSMDDNISLNGARPSSKQSDTWAPSAGPLAGLKRLDRAATAPELSIQPESDLQISYRDVKGPNRFWTYIGPQHMAKNRHLYTPAVLQKFVPSVAADPVELDASEETEIKHLPCAELDGSHPHPDTSQLELHSTSKPPHYHEAPAPTPSQTPPPNPATEPHLQRDTPRTRSQTPPNKRLAPKKAKRCPTPLGQLSLREREDSARDFSEAISVTETIMGEYIVKVPDLPGLELFPPAFPERKRGFDEGDLERAIGEMFG